MDLHDLNTGSSANSTVRSLPAPALDSHNTGESALCQFAFLLRAHSEFTSQTDLFNGFPLTAASRLQCLAIPLSFTAYLLRTLLPMINFPSMQSNIRRPYPASRISTDRFAGRFRHRALAPCCHDEYAGAAAQNTGYRRNYLRGFSSNKGSVRDACSCSILLPCQSEFTA